jgi:hypothetical protein
MRHFASESHISGNGKAPGIPFRDTGGFFSSIPHFFIFLYPSSQSYQDSPGICVTVAAIVLFVRSLRVAAMRRG